MLAFADGTTGIAKPARRCATRRQAKRSPRRARRSPTDGSSPPPTTKGSARRGAPLSRRRERGPRRARRRARRTQLPHAHAGHTTLIAGYSQGGHAALWANQLARSWAPSLHVVGTFAGAPATEVDRILEAGRSRPIQHFVLSIIAGYAAAYPNADPAAYLTGRGVGEVAFVDRGCLGSVASRSASTPPDQLVRPEGPTDAAWLALARANNPGSVAGESPVLIVHSDQDDVVPVELSRILHDRMCAHHEVVERRVIHAGGHLRAALPAYDLANQWMLARLDGTPAKDDC